MALDITTAFNNLRQTLQDRNRDITIGGVITDLLITVATESTRLRSLSTLTSRLQSLDDILEMQEDAVFITDTAEALQITETELQDLITAALEAFAANFSITRLPATASTGTVFFGRETILTSPEGDITIPTGTAVSSTSDVIYLTTADVVMTVANASSFFDTSLNLFVVEAPVAATIPGPSGNTVEDTIIILNTSIPGITSVTNKTALVTGTDEESDEELVTRIKAQLTGNNVGSLDGYRSLILNTGLVSDAAIIGADNALMLRGPGSVDVYLLESRLVQAIDNPTQLASILDYTFTTQPVTSITSVIGFKSGIPDTAFTEGVDFDLVKDPNALTSESIRAVDQLVWRNLAVPPDVGTLYEIKYIVNSNIEEIDTLLQADAVHILGTDVLVREGIQLDVDFSAELVLEEGAVFSTVRTATLEAMTLFTNELKFGAALNQSDLIAIIEGVTGVERVKLPVTQFSLSTTTGVEDTIPAAENEFIRLATITLI